MEVGEAPPEELHTPWEMQMPLELHIQANMDQMLVGDAPPEKSQPPEELQTQGEMQTPEELHIRANMDRMLVGDVPPEKPQPQPPEELRPSHY